MNNRFLNKEPFIGFKVDSLKNYADIIDVKFLPGLYEDSSSSIWSIKRQAKNDVDLNSELIIKKCGDHKAILTTPFWKGMNGLFDLTLAQAYQNAEYLYPFIASNTHLRVPKAVDVFVEQNQSALIVEKMQGKAFKTEEITDNNVKVLAQFLAKLHQKTHDRTGKIQPVSYENHPVDMAESKQYWHQKLYQTFLSLNESNKISGCFLEELFIQINSIEINRIVPVMLDLRWDQFAEVNGELTGIFDLDAFVFAPIELDFVILEYLLTPQQATVFKKTYHSYNGSLITLSNEQRNVYRVLLFLMNVLGETNFKTWLNQPAIFTD
ncbi:hypothetical protein JCM30760_17700 [Thiomicrorhabdus hydrogeniphila]